MTCWASRLELYTPIFAVARIVGWSAHRMEELVNVDKIIRPAYQSIMQTKREYVPLEGEIKEKKEKNFFTQGEGSSLFLV